jgi:hypothetical protein
MNNVSIRPAMMLITFILSALCALVASDEPADAVASCGEPSE